MNTNKAFAIWIAAISLSVVILNDANAAAVGVICEYKGSITAPTRSRVKVKGTGLALARYYATVYSGGVWSKYSAVKTAVLSSGSYQAEFEFDSNSEIGKTLISRAFIKGGKALGLLRRYPDNLIIGSVVATCKAG